MQAGVYIILGKDSGNPVGRNMIEDRSLNPKWIVLLPQDEDPPQWTIQNNGDNTYNLQARGAPAAAMDGKLFANLLVDSVAPDTMKWAIDRVGDNVYTVHLANNDALWDTNGQQPGPDAQIAIGPATGSPTQLFTFVPVLE